jgi:hypothetical protein
LDLNEFHTITDVAVLPPSFDYWNEKQDLDSLLL